MRNAVPYAPWKSTPPRTRAVRAIIGAGVLLFSFAAPAHAYIGPGAGFAVLGSFATMLAALVLGVVVLLTWPLRFLVRGRRRRRAGARGVTERVVVLGFDGMDPDLADAMLAEGRLPNLARLRDTGSYTRLGTTCPALSPVAWSSFMTGAGPGRHGIFDFLHRDPRTYLPDLSSVQIRPSRRVLRIGPLRLSLDRPVLRGLRRSKPFWHVLGEHGIFSTVLRVPITFPPEPFPGLLLSGMCVPDLRGTQGSFTFFTTAGETETARIGGECRRLVRERDGCRGALPGPRLGEQPVQAPFRLRAAGAGTMRLEIDGQHVLLRRGEYSDWIAIGFRVGAGKRAIGLCRYLLRQTEPEVELYVSPLNIDPERPALPVSHPVIYSTYLAKRLGPFATLGLAEDTWALNEGVLDDPSFLRQCELLFAEREGMLWNALGNLRRGCVVCVFDTTDRVQHMFWRCREPAHPANRKRAPGLSGDPIAATYERADAVVGKVLAALAPGDTLLVMSDHGFRSFRRGLNLNAWLRSEGYLTLQPGASGEAEWLRDVDWSRTRAYAIGLSGLYLNLQGREAEGIVPKEEAPALKQELGAKLTGWRDEESGETAILRVFDPSAVSPGPYASSGPDLLIGYAPGYRTSWDGAQGKAGGPIIGDNVRAWSGDHCLDPEAVPGVLFCNRRLAAEGAQITDVAPTILALFGITPPGYMEGRSLLPTSDTSERVDVQAPQTTGAAS